MEEMFVLTFDLRMLVYTCFLALVMPMVYLPGRLARPAVRNWAIGNRTGEEPEAAAWVGRAVRAHRNILESLPVFGALVLVAHVSGEANETTARAAQIFFWARVAHFLVYVAGIPYLRTLVFGVSVVAEVVIALQILT
ncbi:MAPEG family protein [Haliangium ochraceum]|uniref:Putative transmembrane protein n=1 Tax=Haliangium ochraceum (strain DSM 14365 / JCM 11303 / SMP-2) TaxID=502025 RepID=D0LKQ7_HALO1|nr:MAPEG family protein [Haliangium ochraceum]ACY15105.1 putative transmembrane protein [Haliangium ochraceum DSM 14365]